MYSYECTNVSDLQIVDNTTHDPMFPPCLPQPEFALDFGEVPADDIVDASPTVTMLSRRPLEDSAAVAYEQETRLLPPGGDVENNNNDAAPAYTGNQG